MCDALNCLEGNYRVSSARGRFVAPDTYSIARERKRASEREAGVANSIRSDDRSGRRINGETDIRAGDNRLEYFRKVTLFYQRLDQDEIRRGVKVLQTFLPPTAQAEN